MAEDDSDSDEPKKSGPGGSGTADTDRTRKSSSRKGLSLALTSGVLACLAGTFGKLAMTESDTLWFCESFCESSWVQLARRQSVVLCGQGIVYLRALSFVLMILMNAVMWTTFVKALRFCQTSLEATVTNTAANFFASAIVGRLLFDESVSMMWWLGTLLIIFGLGLMNYSEKGGRFRAGSIFNSTGSRSSSSRAGKKIKYH